MTDFSLQIFVQCFVQESDGHRTEQSASCRDIEVYIRNIDMG